MKERREILTPEHPRWKEFIKMLERGLMFREDNFQLKTQCRNKSSKPVARAIIEDMGFDVEQTINGINARHIIGGYACDCSIVLTDPEGLKRWASLARRTNIIRMCLGTDNRVYNVSFEAGVN